MSEFLEILSEQGKKDLDSFIAKLEQGKQAVKEINAEFAKTKAPSEVKSTIEKTNKEISKSNKLKTEAEKLDLSLIRAQEKLKLANTDTAKQLIKVREETTRLTREQRKQAKETSKHAGEYQKLSAALNNIRTESKNVAASMFKLERTGKKTSEEYRLLELRFKKLSAATNILDKGIKDIDKSLGQHQREVGNYKIATEDLHPALGRVNSQLRMMGLSLDDLATGGTASFKQLGTALANLGRAAITFLLSPIGLVIAALGGLYLLIKNNKDTVIEFDSGLKNVGKTTGLTGEQLDALGDDIVELSRKLKTIGTAALLEYATVAGQLGVKGSENILAFTEALAKLETASNISGEEGGAQIARLLTLTDGGVGNVAAFGDEIVNLGNNFAATEKEILGNATSIAQATAMYKFGRQNVLAYATATKALGIEQEIAGSTLGTLLGVFEKAIRTGDGLQAILDLTGKTEQQFANQFKTDASGALTDYLMALNGVAESGGSVNGELEKIGVTEKRSIRVVGSLATQGYETLALAMDQVKDSSGSLNQEFETANTKLENQLRTFGVAWDNLILTVEDGQGVFGKFFAFISNFGAGILDRLASAIDSVSLAFTEGITPLERAVLAFDYLEKNIKTAIPVLSLIPNIFGKQADKIKEQKKALEDSTQAFKEQYGAQRQAVGAVTALTEAMQKAIDAQRDWQAILRGEDPQATDKRAGSIANLAAQIKILEDEIQELETTDIAGVRTRQAKIKALQDELDAILGVNKATKEQVVIIKDSVAWLEKEISRLETLRDTTALNEKQFNSYTHQIEAAKFQIEEITGAIIKFDKAIDSISLKEAFEQFDSGDEIDEVELEAILTKAKKIKDEMARIKQAQQRTLADLGANIPDAFNIGIGEAFNDLLKANAIEIDENASATERFALEMEKLGHVSKAVGGLIIGVFSQITAARNASIDQQIDKLEQQKEIELAFAGESAAARGEIEERFAREKKRLQEEQARNSKALAIIEATVNTAVAVIKALAVGPPLGPILAAITAALGAAQIAVIASTPIPAFKEGVRGFEGGTAIVGDGGVQEVIRTDKGAFLTPNKPTLVNLPRGADVFKNEQEFRNSLDGILADNHILPSKLPNINIQGSGITAAEIGQQFERVLSKRPTNVINMDKGGFSTYTINQFSKLNNLNNRVTFKGKNV